jgi:hypothetical protein
VEEGRNGWEEDRGRVKTEVKTERRKSKQQGRDSRRKEKGGGKWKENKRGRRRHPKLEGGRT